MMNRNHTPSDSYNHSSMSFAALEVSSQKQQQQQQQQQQHHNLWDYETSTQTLNTHQSYPFFTTTSHFLDCTPPLLPMATTLPFYSPPPQPITNYQDDELLAIGGGGGGGSIGLNLGRRTYFPSGDALALGRLWGRSRGGYAFGHHPPPRCQADGCGADLSGAKHYHRRHKVCEFHSKAAVVFFAGGVQQRFCQQCSRFHELSEFDEAKRSCRKRLADHNRRRRKHKSQPSTSSSSAPKNNSTATSSSEKAKLITKSSRDTPNNKPSTKPSMVAQQIHQKKDLHLRNDPSLSLGGIGRATTSDYVTISESKDASQHLQSHFPNDFFHSQGLLFSSPNEASQSTADVSDMSHHHHHQSSLLQLGQAMFNMDFICSSKENRDFI